MALCGRQQERAAWFPIVGGDWEWEQITAWALGSDESLKVVILDAGQE